MYSWQRFLSYSETSLIFHHTPVWLSSRTQTTANIVEDIREKQISYTVGGNVNMENSMEGPQKTKTKLPYDPAIPLPGI
jgi:hypothetical protein